MLAAPVLPPKQPTLVCTPTLVLRPAEGCVMVTLCIAVQPRASVMVAVHVPAARLIAVAPFCAGVVFHP